MFQASHAVLLALLQGAAPPARPVTQDPPPPADGVAVRAERFALVHRDGDGRLELVLTTGAGGGSASGPANDGPSGGGPLLFPRMDRVPFCPDGLADQALPGNAIGASRVPGLGRLLPLGPELFVDPSGRVGVGTLVPAARLHVAGGDLVLRDGALRVRGSDPSAPLEIGTSAAEPRPHLVDGSTSLIGTAPPSASFADGGYVLRTGDPTLAAALELGPGASGGTASLHAAGPEGAGFELTAAGSGHELDAHAGLGAGAWSVDAAGSSGSFHLDGGAGDGDGRVEVRDADGDLAIELDATDELLGDGGELRLLSDQDDEVATVGVASGAGGLALGEAAGARLVLSAGSSLGSAPALLMFDQGGQERLRLNAQGSSNGASLEVFDSDGDSTLFARATSSTSAIPVFLRMFNSLLAPASLTSVEVTPADVGKSPVLRLSSQSGRTVTLFGQQVAGSTTGGGIEVAAAGVKRFEVYDNRMTLFDTAGNPTIFYDGVAGTKNAVLATSRGRRKVYCSEAAEVCFEDAGVARLAGGVAEVRLDPVFLQTVSVDDEHPLHVSASARSGPGVWVEKHAERIVLHELAGGSGEAVVDWRVQAPRLGLAGVRLEPAGR